MSDETPLTFDDFMARYFPGNSADVMCAKFRPFGVSTYAEAMAIARRRLDEMLAANDNADGPDAA